MKKLIAFVLATLMVLSLAACGGQGGAPADDGSSYGIDFTKEGAQPMSEELTDVATLKKTAAEYLEGNTLFGYSNDQRTYADFKAYIGVDATEYQYDKENNFRNYLWKASDEDTAKLQITFQEKDGKWTLYAAGSTNLGL